MRSLPQPIEQPLPLQAGTLDRGFYLVKIDPVGFRHQMLVQHNATMTALRGGVKPEVLGWFQMNQ